MWPPKPDVFIPTALERIRGITLYALYTFMTYLLTTEL